DPREGPATDPGRGSACDLGRGRRARRQSCPRDRLRRDRVSEADRRRSRRLGGQADRDARASRDRAPARPTDLPRAPGEDPSEVAARRGDAGAARHVSALLALFDLAGTLLLTHEPISRRALPATQEAAYGIEVAAHAPVIVEHPELSAQRIPRTVLDA